MIAQTFFKRLRIIRLARIFIVVSIFISAESSIAQDETSDGRALLLAMQSGRGEVFSGVVAMKLKRSANNKEVHEWRTLYFDKAAGCMRCDRDVTPSVPGGRAFKCTLVQTPQEVLFYDPESNIVSRHPRGTSVNSIKARPPFDPLAAGMGAASYEGTNSFAALANSFLQRPVKSFAARDGLASIELEGSGPADEFLLRLTIDTIRGNTLVSYAEYHVSHEATPVGVIVSKAVASWSLVDETYVPSKWEVLLYDRPYATVEFTWSSVNKELSPDVFSLSGIPMLRGTTIVNHKLGGEPIIEGKTP